MGSDESPPSVVDARLDDEDDESPVVELVVVAVMEEGASCSRLPCTCVSDCE